MFDQIHFAITYTTFFAVSLLFTSYMTDVVEFNEHRMHAKRHIHEFTALPVYQIYRL